MFQEEVKSTASRVFRKAREKVKRVTCKSLLEVPKESTESSIKEPTRMVQEKSMRSMKRVLEFPTESFRV